MILSEDGLVHPNWDIAISLELKEIHDVLKQTSEEFDDNNCQ